MQQSIQTYVSDTQSFKVETTHIQADQYLCLVWEEGFGLEHKKLKATIHSTKQTCVVMVAKFMSDHDAINL